MFGHEVGRESGNETLWERDPLERVPLERAPLKRDRRERAPFSLLFSPSLFLSFNLFRERDPLERNLGNEPLFSLTLTLSHSHSLSLSLSLSLSSIGNETFWNVTLGNEPPSSLSLSLSLSLSYGRKGTVSLFNDPEPPSTNEDNCEILHEDCEELHLLTSTTSRRHRLRTHQESTTSHLFSFLCLCFSPLLISAPPV
jgi:hypothetical protein